MTPVHVLWDCGTAYDLFVSLVALHRPAMLGIRPSWAAGVRARLPVDVRDTLEQAHRVVDVPFHWLHRLPEPKDGATVIGQLQRIAPADRLAHLAAGPDSPPALVDLLAGISLRKGWNEADRQALEALVEPYLGHGDRPSSDEVVAMLDAWAEPQLFGERYLRALRTYHDVFFAEEERRIAPALRAALSSAQALATDTTLPALLEELSRGLVFDEPQGIETLVLAPSYWSTPLVYFGKLDTAREIWLFGARPPGASLVPGAPVPDTLLQALKALSDPTRLRILRYLAHEPLSPADLTRRLRLRLPTVTHHLKTLRLAGLVRLAIHEGKATGMYASRPEAVAATYDLLTTFLSPEPDDA